MLLCAFSYKRGSVLRDSGFLKARSHVSSWSSSGAQCLPTWPHPRVLWHRPFVLFIAIFVCVILNAWWLQSAVSLWPEDQLTTSSSWWFGTSVLTIWCSLHCSLLLQCTQLLDPSLFEPISNSLSILYKDSNLETINWCCRKYLSSLPASKHARTASQVSVFVFRNQIS